MKKISLCIVWVCLIALFAGCADGSPSVPGSHSNTSVSSAPLSSSESASLAVSSAASASQSAPAPIIKEVDFSPYFSGANGSAVFYHSQSNTYQVFNAEGCNTQVSPCSTFKIISAALGLEHQVLTDETTTMQYSGAQYAREAWNHNATLKEAFQSSCVWYFRQVIDAVGADDTAEMLSQLQYGNCDISQWEGGDINPAPELNGFWIESSLKISPMEQVQALGRIFDGQAAFSDNTLTVLKEIMKLDTDGTASVYGKTGSGRQNAWFTGFFETGADRWYFSVNLQGDANATGADAKQIALSILQNCF